MRFLRLIVSVAHAELRDGTVYDRSRAGKSPNGDPGRFVAVALEGTKRHRRTVKRAVPEGAGDADGRGSPSTRTDRARRFRLRHNPNLSPHPAGHPRGSKPMMLAILGHVHTGALTSVAA